MYYLARFVKISKLTAISKQFIHVFAILQSSFFLCLPLHFLACSSGLPGPKKLKAEFGHKQVQKGQIKAKWQPLFLIFCVPVSGINFFFHFPISNWF